MSFQNFFINKVLPSFFISVTFITIAMAILGVVFFKSQQFGYEGFWSPIIFGAVAVLPQLITYSKNELSAKQMLFRNILHLILLEAIILQLYQLNAPRYSTVVTLSLALSVFIIYVTVHLVLWINDKRIAKEFNERLRAWQDSISL